MNEFYKQDPDARIPSVIMPKIRRTFPELPEPEIIATMPSKKQITIFSEYRKTNIDELRENGVDELTLKNIGKNGNPEIKRLITDKGSGIFLTYFNKDGDIMQHRMLNQTPLGEQGKWKWTRTVG